MKAGDKVVAHLMQKPQGTRRDSPSVWLARRAAVNYRLPAEKEAPHA